MRSDPHAERLHESAARDLALRLAGANHSRRLYSMRGPIWERTLASLAEKLSEAFETGQLLEITFALLGDGLAVCGVPVLDPPSSVVRLIGQLKERDIEIISIRRGVEGSELEALMAFIGADTAELLRADVHFRELGIDRVSIKHLRLTRGEGEESFREIFWRGKKQLAREFERAAKKNAISQGAIAELAASLLEVIADAKTPIATLLALRDRDDLTLVHSVNCGILAGIQAAAFGLAEEEASQIVLAALLHDIGKTKVPEGLLSSGSVLNDRERALVARHTIEGARLLLQNTPRDRLAAVVALEHHQPTGDRHLAVEIVRVADVFDTIRTLRPFHDARSMRGAVAYMIRTAKARLDPFVLERFAALVDLFHEGDHARLSTGEIIRIRRPNPELALHPVIEVLDKSTGHWPRGQVEDLAKLIGDERTPHLIPTLPSLFGDLEFGELEALG